VPTDCCFSELALCTWACWSTTKLTSLSSYWNTACSFHVIAEKMLIGVEQQSLIHSIQTDILSICRNFIETSCNNCMQILCLTEYWLFFFCFFFNAKMDLKSEEQQMETTFIIFVKTTFCLCFRIHFFPQCLRMNYQKLGKPFWQQGILIQMKTQCFTVSN
jgi:hypothetical protein